MKQSEEKKKLLCFDDLSYAEPFKDVYDVVFANNKETFPKLFASCDTVLFTGGADVSPFLYNEPKGESTYTNPSRDRFEWTLMQECVKQDKTILGICRGAQLACVFAGGSLVQDTNGHLRSHVIVDVFGNEPVMPSTHHQMMRYYGASKSTMIAWTKTPLSDKYLDGKGESLYAPFKYIEPEIVYFEEIKALAIQGHPEMSNDDKLHEYCCSLVKFYLFKEQEQYQPYYPQRLI